MIYGTVHVTQEELEEKKTIPVPSGGYGVSLQTITSIRRTSTAAVNFTMDDVQTSKTLCSVTVTRKYDSKDKEDKKKYGKEAPEVITQRLLQECVAEFLSKISPHRVEVTEYLDDGLAQELKDGNKFAKLGEYDDAIRLYRSAIDKNARDGAAMFNLGLCYEARGDVAEAYAWYDRALKIEPKYKYIPARKRVRQESENGSGL
jgi:tetratricopeptide (TPR) repeat protein